VIIKDGKLEKVDMSRVYDIRDKEGAEWWQKGILI
jgi:hypothetical protein